LIVIAEFDRENSHLHERLEPGRRFKKNSSRGEGNGEKGVGQGN
jgi:hypothetical protein